MKKNIFMVLIFVLCLSLCSCSFGGKAARCSHSFYLSDYVSSTDTAKGYYEYICSKCGVDAVNLFDLAWSDYKTAIGQPLN